MVENPLVKDTPETHYRFVGAASWNYLDGLDWIMDSYPNAQAKPLVEVYRRSVLEWNYALRGPVDYYQLAYAAMNNGSIVPPDRDTATYNMKLQTMEAENDKEIISDNAL